MKQRKPIPELESLSRAAAFAVAAAIMLVPANLLPVISSQKPGEFRTDTIYSGILALFHQDLWGLGLIVFCASIVIPLLKLVGLGWLLLAVRHGDATEPRQMTRLYIVLTIIGRWSMLDVFLVAFISGIVRFGAFANVQPRSGIAAFAAAVVLTMLATEAFDPRFLWRQPLPAAVRAPQP